MTAENVPSLARRLRDGEFITAPGVFDLVSARVADRFGFKALYMTGYGVAASHLGMPDAGYATYRDMVDRVRQIGRLDDMAALSFVPPRPAAARAGAR